VRVKKPAPARPAATAGGLSPGLRRYLYFTAAMTGAGILIVEILGAKMLAPYFGTSHFVWTAQIAVTLVSLATGYYFGGWLVDRSQKLGRIYGCILLAAVYLTITIAAAEPVAFGALKFKLATGSILAALFLFFIPLTLLAAVGPFFIRALLASVAGAGVIVGRLSAISTLGSVAGTLLIAYVLIPLLPNSVTMYLTAGGLAGLTAVYFAVWGRKSREISGVVVGILAVVGIGFAGVRRDAVPRVTYGTQLFRGNSDFGQLQVIRDQYNGYLYYLNDYLTQNTYDPVAKQSVSMFTYLLHGLGRAYAERGESVLAIGLGVGIAPMQFAREGARVDVVEINPAVVPLAEKFFDFEPGRMNLTIGDGRQFLNETTNRYDVLMLDAFLGDSSPSHLMTREAFGAMSRVLRPGGVLVINSFGEFTAGEDFFTASLDKTLKATFASVRIHAAGNGNVFFVAANEPELRRRREPELAMMHPIVRNQVRAAFDTIREVNPASGRVLTDDYNPVEFHDAANRERFRRQLAFSMRPR
jgi:spermidine synthase